MAKSRKAPRQRAERRSTQGADLVFVWGGDGMVQRCIDALAGTGRDDRHPPGRHRQPVRHQPRHPAGPRPTRSRSACTGDRRAFDVGVINGERFAVMAGAGFDAKMIRDADGGLKDQAGRLAYVWTGARQPERRSRARSASEVDGAKWFDGRASCVLFGNVGTLTGGLTAFADARPDDGVLEIGVVTAKGAVQWSRVLGRMAAGRPSDSPFTRADHRAARSTSVSTTSCPTSSTVATVRRAKRLRVRDRARRDHASASPTGRSQHEHRHRRPRDLGADRRRRP